MRDIIIYAAASANGFIAKEDGNVEWLDLIPNPEQSDYGYFDFYKSIDTTLMGNNTYREVLGFDVPFPYPDKTNYVFTRDTRLNQDRNVKYISGDIVAFTKELKNKTGKDIWLVGGGEINSLMLKHGLVNRIHLHLMPYVFGKGIPLFSPDLGDTRLKLESSHRYSSGVLELKYVIDS